MASSPRVARVLELVAELTPEEREEVEIELADARFPGEVVTGEEWERVWAEEIERRRAAGGPTIPWEEVRAHLDAELARIRADRAARSRSASSAKRKKS
ncbi:MAG TPA: hypothetical protein VF765_14305 [Polyangiaceae bacterium]